MGVGRAPRVVWWGRVLVVIVPRPIVWEVARATEAAREGRVLWRRVLGRGPARRWGEARSGPRVLPASRRKQ